MQKSEAAQEDFMKTERSYNFSTSKSIKSLLKLVGAGLCARPSRVRNENSLCLL